MTVQLGQSRFNADQDVSLTVTGPRGTVTVHDEHMAGLFTVRGLGTRQYVHGPQEAYAMARNLVGLEAE